MEIKHAFKRRAVCIQRDVSGKKKGRKSARRERERSQIKERKKRESLELWILYARGASRGGGYTGMVPTAGSPKGNNYILRVSAP